MLRATFFVCAILPYMFAARAPDPASTTLQVREVSLERLARYSDVIVIGEVEKILTVRIEAKPNDPSVDLSDFGGNVSIARVRTTKVLRGPTDLRTVHFVAQGRWMCDVSGAVEGETALFFLTEETSPTLRDAFQSSVPGRTLYQDTWSGRGRMPIHRVAERESVTFWNEVKLPESIPTVPAKESESWSFQTAQLGDVTRVVELWMKNAKRPYFAASATRAWNGGAAWDLTVTEDRKGRLVIHAASGDREASVSVSSNAACWFDGLFEPDRSQQVERIGKESTQESPRILRQLGSFGSRVVEIHALDAAAFAGENRGSLCYDALMTWRCVRSSFDHPECADHRAIDDVLLRLPVAVSDVEIILTPTSK